MPSAGPIAEELMTVRPTTLPHDAPISRALGLMRTRGIHEVPVLRRSRLAGMITFEMIARRASRPLDTKVEHLLTLAPLVTPTTAEILLANGLRAAPVVGRKGELLGVVSRTDLVRALPTVPEAGRTRVEEIARAPELIVRENELCRHLFGQIRILESHPLPVVDRKGRLVGAVGVADLGAVLWRPTAPGKRDAGTGRAALDVRVGSIMRSPAVTVPVGTSAAEAALLMTRERVSSVFVVEDGRPPRVLGQVELLGLVVGRSRPARGPARVEDVYVEISGLRGSGDPGLLADIDRLVAGALRRIAREVRPTLLTLHFAPHATHRTSDTTVEGRLHSDAGILYASHTGWNLLAGVATILDDLAAQARRVREERRERGRGSRASRSKVPEEEVAVEDPELERKIRSASGDGPEDEP